MDFKERLARLEERRGETIDQTMEKVKTELAATTDVVALAELLGNTPDGEIDEIVELIGGLEHYVPYKTLADEVLFFTGLEDISETLVRIFDRIIAFIKRWIKALADADFKLSLYTAMHAMNLDNLRTDMRSTASKPRNSSTFAIRSRIQNLSVNYRPINNPQQLLNSLTILQYITNMYFDKHSDNVVKSVRAVSVAVAENKPAEQIAHLVQVANPMQVAPMTVFRQMEQHLESANMMGNHRFVITNNNAGSTDLVERVQGVRILLAPSQLTPSEPPPQIDFQYFDLHMADSLLNKCSGLLTTLATSNTGLKRHQRKQAMTTLLQSVEKVNTDIQRNGIRDEAEARRVVVVLETYISWIADPYTSFYAYVLRNVRATMNVVEANVA